MGLYKGSEIMEDNKINSVVVETYYQMFNESLWVSGDIINNLIEFNKELYLNKDYIEVTLNQIANIAYNNIYPKEVIGNICKMLDFYSQELKDSLSNNISSNPATYLKKINDIKILLKIIATYDTENYEFLDKEFVYKYSDLNSFNKLRGICYQDIMNGIKNDSLIFSYLLSGDDKEILENELLVNSKEFILFIKKMLAKSPNVLEDAQINHKISIVLNKNIEDKNLYQEESRKLLKHINSNELCGLQIINEKKFKNIYFYSLIDSLLCSYNIKDDLNKLDQSLLRSHTFLYELSKFIDKLDNDRDKQSVENLKEIIHFYGENYKLIFPKNDHEDILERINYCKCKLNSQVKESNVYLICEIANYYDKIYNCYNKMYKNIMKDDFSEIKEMINSFYKVINSYIISDEQFKKINYELVYDDYYINAINKLLLLYPYFFYDDNILNRTIDILNEKISILRKNQPFNLIERRKYQKVLKEVKKH